MGGREEQGDGSEERDMFRLIKMCLAFGPGDLNIYKEVGIFGTKDQYLH